ncbi:ribosomal-protein-alanine N-acetyltransferase [Agrobacterium vitis]|nr:ribosomal-protein-alanine N-acetyltransferase [Agrobacterium vitis]MBE1438664.1 ribosomal-protein-alanine N-acetyltransferase [Agrobacterium vitis]
MARIRSAHSDEANILADIGFRAWEQAMLSVGDTRSMVENARNAFRNFARSGLMSIIVIEHMGQPVGWAARENLDDKITDFWIDPPHQGRGYSKLLLQAIEADIIHRGFDEAHLETHARNKQAVDFFQHHGYGVRWLSVVYNPKLDRDIEMVGMSRQLVSHSSTTYGPGGAFE